MILTMAYDVEILPNFFSIVIIDVKDYLKTFADANDGNNPIPLVQKYTVKEIKEKLAKVKKHKYYITDKDDSQLIQMLGCINNMRPHLTAESVAVRTDMFGYNSSKYDRLMVAGLLMLHDQTNSTKELITKLYELSQKIISLQDNYELAKNDYFINNLKKYNLPYVDIDIMSIFALNKVGKGEDSKGNTVYFGKSLKQTSINLQWYELLEHELPPISDKDVELYWKDERYKGLSADYLNRLIDKWDRYILDEWIDDTMHYNENDVFIVCEMIRLYINEIRLRYNLSKAYEIDCLSSSRSNIADTLFVKFYSEFSNLQPHQWRGKKTERTALSFKKVILPFIQFKTKPLQELLVEMNQVILYSIGKKAIKEVAHKYPHFKYLKTSTESGWFEVTINKLVYTIATGGLHTQDIPRELRSKMTSNSVSSSTGEALQSKTAIPSDAEWSNLTDDSYVYVHWDINASGVPIKIIPIELLEHREDNSATT